MKEIQFPDNIEKNRYKVFPEEYEDDSSIIFHGTNQHNFRKIQEHGFQPAETLESVSFSNTSSVPLAYACKKRGSDSSGVVIAVSISTFQVINQGEEFSGDGRPIIVKNGDVYHLYKFDNQPTILAFCIVPDKYQHI